MPDRTTAIERIIDFMIGAGGLEIFRQLFFRKKTDAEIDKIVSDNWRDYATKLELRFKELEDEYKELRHKYYQLEDAYHELKKQVNDTANNNHSGA